VDLRQLHRQDWERDRAGSPDRYAADEATRLRFVDGLTTPMTPAEIAGHPPFYGPELDELCIEYNEIHFD
jgi:hypothetical protein